MAISLLSLGSNIGNSADILKKALQAISCIDGVTLLKSSSLYRTKPWGYTAQDDFINSACVIETSLNPLSLLHCLQQIELDFHRERLFKYGPRTLDIDIIACDSLCMDSKELILPHPLMTKRAFVLVPLFEIAPDFIIEPYHLSIKALKDKLSLKELQEAQRCA